MFSQSSPTYNLYEKSVADLDSLKIAFFSATSLAEKTQIQDRYNKEIDRQYQLFEELKMELDEMEEDTALGNYRDTKKLNHILSVSQLSGLEYPQLKTLVTELRSIQKSIPTTAKVFHGLEREMYYDDPEIKVK